jgi:oligoribonuclease NrnB/cAMP/cGMP phosphodiesterase (DHH superfamily)
MKLTELDLVKLYTHGDDLDGKSCYLVLLSILRNDFGDAVDKHIDVNFESYDTINDSLEKFINSGDYKRYKAVFITDIGISLELADKIAEINKKENRFLLFDHHVNEKTNPMKNYPGFHITDVDVTGRKQSAAKLLFSYFKDCVNKSFLPSLHVFVNLVSDYDTYTWKIEKNEMPKRLHQLCALYGDDKFFKKYKNAIFFNESFFTANDYFLIDIDNQQAEKYIKAKLKEVEIMQINGFKTGVVFSDKGEYCSELGIRICEELGVDVAAMINTTSKKIQYRSISKDFHLGNEFASKFGGSGHMNAAGNQIPKSFFNNAYKELFKI